MIEKRAIDFIPQIDGLRFVAVFGVMISHWVAQDFTNSFILNNIPFGTGVNLFFVISGFLITFILLKKKDDIIGNKTSFLHEIRNFYVKRTLRIFPIYYLLLLLLCLFYYSDIKEYVIYLFTYTINWYMVFNGVYIGNKTHLWSLAVEEQFYLIWPFLIFLTPKKWILWLITFFVAISIISKIYFMYYTTYWMGVNGATFSCFDSLGLGAIIAYIQKKKTTSFNSRAYKIGFIISLFVYVLLFIYPSYLNEELKRLLLNSGTSVVFFFMVMIAANNGFNGTAKSFLENKIILYLGKISYGLYLYHNFVPAIYFGGVNNFFPKLKGDADIFVIYFLITLVLSTISWYLIERPILTLKKYFQ